MSNLRCSGLVVGVLLLTASMWGVSTEAQEQRRGRDESPQADEPKGELPEEPAEPVPYPVPPGLYRDFGFPDPDRPWGRGRYLDSYRRGGRRRVPGGYYRPGYGQDYGRYYYDDYTYRFGVPYRNDPYSDDLERAYRQGMADGQNYERFEIQAERRLCRGGVRRGREEFSAGGHAESG